MQFLGLASVVAVLTIAGVSAASTLRNRAPAETTSGGAVVSDPRPAAATGKSTKPSAPKADGVVQQSTPVAQSQPAVTDVQPIVPATTPTPIPTAPPSGFIIVEGRSQLSDSVVATRSGDSVIVNFDAYGYRTRRASRFENSLRETLPLVYGRTATASLDSMVGEIVTEHDVVGALAREGMRFTLDNGVGIRIKVLTRIVSDGPIAIGYVTTVER